MGKKHKSDRDRSRSPVKPDAASHRTEVKREREDRDDRREQQRRERRRNGHEREENRSPEREREDRRGGGGGGGGRRSGPGSEADSKPKFDKDKEKQKPNLGLSGKLTEDTNTFRGVVIKYNEPSEARKPKVKWRLYQFKGAESLPTLYVHRQSAYLIGRDRLIADIPVDHPSCSKQHAVLQFRLVDYVREDGTHGRRVSPYIIDLGATNKTYLNNKPIEAQRYHELREKDVLKFGYSSREYVLLHDRSADSPESDEESN